VAFPMENPETGDATSHPIVFIRNPRLESTP